MTPFEQEMLEKLFNLHGAITSPRCAICDKKVDKMGVEYKTFEGKYYFKIECHNDTCEMRVAEKYALDPKYKFQVGDAFIPNMTNRMDGKVIEEIQ